MLTGHQIREARGLLGLSPSKLAEKARIVTTVTVKRAESTIPGPPVADGHLKAIQRTLEALGIEFTPEGPRLRKVATAFDPEKSVLMPIVSAPVDLNALRTELEAAREMLMTSFQAKQEADRHYMEAFATYERIADILRHSLTAANHSSQKPTL